MEDEKRIIKIKEDEKGSIKVSDDVVAIVSGLAATEVEGVARLVGDVTNELVAKVGKKNLSKGVKLNIDGTSVHVGIAVMIMAGYTIPDVSKAIQERVTAAVETMTGLTVTGVDVKISSVETE